VVVFTEILVHIVKPRVILIFVLDEWRWGIIGLSPELDLLFAMDLCGFLFVKALQSTIMSFINFPVLMDFCVFF
jgi:hypothetical protein